MKQYKYNKNNTKLNILITVFFYVIIILRIKTSIDQKSNTIAVSVCTEALHAHIVTDQ